VNPLVLLFMAIVTFLLAIIAYASLIGLAVVDPELASTLGYGVIGAGAVGVAIFGVGALVALMTPPTDRG